MCATDTTTAESGIRLLRAEPLTAVYSLGKSYVTGDWIAVGSVRSTMPPEHLPVWILVGRGTSPSKAVEDLHHLLVQESLRFRAWSQNATHAWRPEAVSATDEMAGEA